MDRIRFSDCYGRSATAIRDVDGSSWKLTYHYGRFSKTERYRTEAHMRAKLKHDGISWTEVG